jgi:hypothetical protein
VRNDTAGPAYSIYHGIKFMGCIKIGINTAQNESLMMAEI